MALWLWKALQSPVCQLRQEEIVQICELNSECKVQASNGRYVSVIDCVTKNVLPTAQLDIE
jgi:hypothetical protein